MKRWRRVMRLTAIALLVIVIGLIGTLIWLQSSGRLTRYAQELAQGYSGHNLSFESLAFDSWNVVTLINVRLQQTLPGWQIDVACPRVEVHYTLLGLRRKQVFSVHLIQPTVHLKTIAMPATSSASTEAPDVIVFPVERLEVRDATLHVDHGNTLYTLEQIEVSVRRISAPHVSVDARAHVADNTAQVHLKGDLSLDLARLTGTFDASLRQVSVPQLAASGLFPSNWMLTEGTLEVVASQVELQGQTLRGRLKIDLQRGHGDIAAVQVQGAAMTTEMSFEAAFAGRTFNLQGPMQLQAATVLQASNGLMATQLTVQLPVQLAYAPEQWVIEGTAAVKAHRLHVGTDKRTTASLGFEHVQGQMPLRITPMALTSPNLHLQAKALHWQPGTDTPIASPLDLHTSIAVNLQRQQMEVKNLVLNLTEFGRITGGGTWQWATGVAQDVYLTMVPKTLETVWPHVATRLPAPYPTWQVSGQSQIELHIPNLAWRDGAPTQPLSMDWHFSEITFTSPEGDYAGEHISGQMAINVSLAPDWRPASVQASLALKPFALLIGSFFPELEKNHVESQITLNSVYHPETGHVDLNLNGAFGPLGHMAIQGRLDRSRAPMQADITCHLSQIDVQNVWQTFMPEALRQAADPPAMQGRLNARLQLRGALSKAHLQGDLQLTKFYLQAGAFNLHKVSLQLPLDIHYPLPESLPDVAALPASAYGHLHLERLQVGGLLIPSITTKLALRSDSLIFQKDIRATLLQGVMHLQNFVAYQVLRPQRQLQMQLRLRSLHLQDLQRNHDALPIAGQVDADFSRLHFQNERLQTEGSMQLQVAGGRLRIYDVAGWDLWSPIPSIQASLQTDAPLSLHQLTQIYPIGTMGGTLHVTVDDLTITAGEPAAFRLYLYVQEQGGETRQISLRALNNLLFTTGSAKVASNFTNQLPYSRFGAEITLQHDTLRLRGLYQDRKGREYFMRAPALGSGISIVNEKPKNNSIAFRSFVQRLKSTVLEGPDVNVK